MPDQHDGSDLIRRFETLAGNRGTWESTSQQIADHMLGRRDFNTTVDRRTQGRQRMQRIYDTTGLLSATLLTSALHTLLTNPASRWFRLKVDDDLLRRDDVADWIEIAQNTMLSAFRRPEGGFAPQISETYFELVSFGTGGFFVLGDVLEGPIYMSRPIQELFVAENELGRIDTVMRKFCYTAKQAQQDFGRGASKKADEMIAKGQPYETLEFLHVLEPRDTPDPAAFGATRLPIESVYVSFDDKRVVSHGGYHEMPVMVARWSKDPGETYGRGPGTEALSDIKMLNEMSKVVLKAAQKSVDPPTLIPDEGVIGKVRLEPGGTTVYRAGMFSEDPIRPFPGEYRVDIGVEMLKLRQATVRSHFKAELLPLLQQPLQTATQVVEMVGQAQRMLAPILGRQHTELQQPILNRTFGILLRNRMFPPPPEVLIDREIEVEYVSPVQRAQKQSDAKAITDWAQGIQLIGQIDPSALDVFNGEEAGRVLADSLGVPVRTIRGVQQIAERRAAEAEAQAADTERQDLEMAAGAAGKLAPLLKAVQGGQAA